MPGSWFNPRRREDDVWNRNSANLPWIRVAVGTQSVGAELFSDNSAIVRLLGMTCFPQVDIVCTPTDDEAIAARLSELGVKMAQCSTVGENLVVYDGGFLGAFREPLARLGNFRRQVEPGSGVSVLDDLFARDRQVDLFVVGSADPYRDRESVRPTRVASEQALDLVRLLFLINEVYELRPGLPVAPWIYYVVRAKRVFPSFQRAWTMAAYASEERLPGEMYRQLESLGHRMGFLLRAADRASVNALKDPGNTAEEESLFHLGYLIMLATGLFDDLAWIIQHRYNLGVHPKEVGLRYNPKRPDYFKRMKRVNPSLHAYLMSEPTQTTVKMIYPIRDQLQHQMFLRSLLLSSSRHHGIVFEFPAGFASSVEMRWGAESLADWGIIDARQEYVDPHRFSSGLVTALAEVVNSVLSGLEVEKVTETLPTGKAEAIRASLAKFEVGLGHFMDWGYEPLYF